MENKIRIQREGVQAWIANDYKGTLAWATGVGKSKAAIDCINLLRTQTGNPLLPILLVTPTEEMRDEDWPAEFEKWNTSMEGIKCICYASLAKENLAKYEFIVYDECHRITLPNLETLKNIDKPILGLTATFPRKRKFDEEDALERIELIGYLLPPVHTISTDEAVDLGLISDFEVLVLQFYLDGVAKNVPCGTKAKEMRTEKTQYAKLTKKMQWAIIKKIDGLKFGAISARMNFLYNLPSKSRLAKQCLDSMEQGDKRTLVFAGSIEQCEELCGKNVYHSKSTGEALKAFQRKEINTLGAVRSLNEGKNLTEPDQALVVQIDSVKRNLVQRIGRIIRKRYDNPEFKAKIVILVALNTADYQWYKSSIEDFQTSRIKEYIVRVPDIVKPIVT